MNNLSHHDITILFLSLSLLLFVARGFGELARHFHQPAVLGEILAGVILGPTVLGYFNPSLQQIIFPSQGPLTLVLNSFMTIAITLFLLVAGLEVDLSSVFRQGKSALRISFWGLLIPFALGAGAAFLFPNFWGNAKADEPLAFALFLGTALGISALPVIAKIMMDLNLYRTDLGMIIISAAVINDVAGWIIFAVVLGMIGTHAVSVGHLVLLTAGFVFAVLVVGRWVLDRILPWLQARLSWPGGIIGFTLASGLLCAALTEAIGIHALFGAFLFGVALGDSRHLREKTRTTIDQFVSFFFAPLFFASIGLKVNFIANFDLTLTVVLILLATAGKLIGCFGGAKVSGFSARQSMVIGLGMNARGAMEIILGLLALEGGLITEKLFVALVIMALFTSVTSGSLMQLLMRRKKEARFFDYLSNKGFVRPLVAHERREAIIELVGVACAEAGLNTYEVADLVWEREGLIPTGLEHGVAVPHARLANITQPMMVVGISKVGIDFDAPDGEKARLIFLILTPLGDHEKQLEILSDISKTYSKSGLVLKSLEAKSFNEFLACIKSGE